MNFAREKTRKVIVEENYVIDITIVIRLMKVSIQINKKRRKKGVFVGILKNRYLSFRFPDREYRNLNTTESL